MDKTVVKAFGVLERLVEVGRPAGITELSVALGLQKSNVHRLLSTLTALGYVGKVNANLYEPTLRMWEIGQNVYAGYSIVSLARPHMRRLVEMTGETAHLAVFDQTEIVYLDKVESPNPVRAYTAIGDRAPAYCTASGKALLAYQEDSVIQTVARTIKPKTPKTIRTLAALRQEMGFVRKRGFATNLAEFEPNVAGLAAPIRNGHGEVVAAIGIAGPLDRLRPRKVKSLAPAVMAVAISISDSMGTALTSRVASK